MKRGRRLAGRERRRPGDQRLAREVGKDSTDRSTATLGQFAGSSEDVGIDVESGAHVGQGVAPPGIGYDAMMLLHQRIIGKGISDPAAARCGGLTS